MSPTPEFRLAAASSRAKRRSRSRRLVLLLVLVLAVPLVAAVWRVGPAPELTLQTDLPGLGRSTTVTAEVREPVRGLGTVLLELQQGDLLVELARREATPRPFWKFWGPLTSLETLSAVVDSVSYEALSEGEALLRLSATRAPTWLRRPAPVVLERRLPVRLRPPTLTVESSPNYVSQGGAGLVLYRVGETGEATAARHGVLVGEQLYPGHPVPGNRDGLQFALYAAPYDLESAETISLIAEDALRNRAATPFVDSYRARPLKTSRIRLDDAFLTRVVPAIRAETPDLSTDADLLAGYLEINGELRRRNAEELRRMAGNSEPRLLWRGAFAQQPGAQVMDRFAARRTYVYEGRAVDTQDHLGLDLASVRRAPVVASQAGRVVLAKSFGIYGRTVVLDHGYGLMTLYAHLSAIEVEEGQQVERLAQIGRSGATGLAGGDHLHFTVLLGGTPVTPLEWFDGNWLRQRILEPLGVAEAVGRGDP